MAIKKQEKNEKTFIKKQSKATDFLLHATWVVVGLAIVLSAAKLSLHAYRYDQVFDESTYQAVSLVNGQTFIGRLDKYSSNTYVLFDVYYLQETATTNPKLTTETTTTEELPTQQDSGLQLMKLSDDFHAPKNHVVLNREHILYWQDLDQDSPILKTILENQ
ncbi:MAG: hypothetical protein Q8P90_03650 [bacterium]|nr:hypothetical protein [bacterium]